MTREAFYSWLDRAGPVRLISRARFAIAPSLAIGADHFGSLAGVDIARLARETGADWQIVAPTLAALPTDGLGWSSGSGEQRTLYHLARGLGVRRILEIGTHIGTATAHLAAALTGQPGAEVVTLDVVNVNAPDAAWRRAGLSESPAALCRRVAPDVPVRFVTQSAADYLAGTRESFDLAYIDGAHGATDVYRELATLSHRLTPGGYLVLHDYDPDGHGSVRGPTLATHRLCREAPDLGVVPLAGPWGSGLPRPSVLAVIGRR